MVHHVICTMLLVQIAVRKPRFRSRPMVTGPSTVGIVIRSIGQRDSKVDIYLDRSNVVFSFSFLKKEKLLFILFLY
jgi:hypothetical protein